jgi:hypothetical protein
MAIERIATGSDYLNVVHKVIGDLKVIEFLRRGSVMINERLFYNAKRDGQASFFYKDKEYFLIHNRDSSYTIVSADEGDEGGMAVV